MASEETRQPSDDPRGSPEFEGLLAGYIEQFNRSGFVDPDQVIEENPRLGSPLLEDLKTYIQLQRECKPEAPLGTLGDYTLRRQIGRGGMGVVYEAWENSMDRRVALKVLPAGVAADTRAVTRFVREAQAAGKLQHPNVVSVFGMGLKEQTPYYAMEFVEGKTLAQLLGKLKDADENTITPFGKRGELAFYSDLATAFADVADGLQHAHSKGVTHRDIKPSNLILDGEGRLRILDFGLARLEGQESLTLTGDFLGTPLYMSPELARRKKIPVDHRTDIYSLGATLYEMLALRPPFQGKDQNDTLSQIIEREPVEPRKLNPRVPRDLETIVLKCLRKDAGDRYGTAEALGQDLRRFVRGEVIEARAETRWEQMRRRAWRVRRIIAVGLLLAFALAAAGWILLDRFARERERRERSYVGKVVSAALRLELASLIWQASSNLGGLGELVHTQELPGAPAIDPSDLALKDLDEAVVLIPGRVDARYHRARALLLLSRHDEAREALEPLIALRPCFIPALNALADLHRREGKADRSDAIFMEAEKLATDGWSGAWVHAWRGWRNGKPVEAAAAYTRLLAECAGGREPFLGCALATRLSRGSAYLEAGEPMKAARDFAMAQALAPEAIEPALLEVKSWIALGRTDDAARLLEETYTRAAEKDEVALIAANMCLDLRDEKGMHSWLDRVSVPSVRELSRSQSVFELGQWEAAMGAARKAISHDARNYRAWDRLGFMLMIQGHLREAHEALEAGLKVAPEYSELHHEQGSVYFREGEFAKAAACYERAAQLNRQRDRCEIYKLAATYILMGEHEKATAATDEAHWRDPGNGEGEGYLAMAYCRSGNLIESLEAANRGIAGRPAFSFPHYWKCLALVYLNREDEAVSSWRATQPFFPITPNLFLLPAMLLQARGRPDEALPDLLRALPFLPGDERIHAVLARCLRDCRGRLDPSKIDEARAAIEAAWAKEPASGWARNSLALAELLRAPPANEAIERAFALLLDVQDAPDLSRHLRIAAAASLADSIELASGGGAGIALEQLRSLHTPVATDALFAALGFATGIESVPEQLLFPVAADPKRQGNLLYLKARLAERTGDLQSAAAMLARVPAEAAPPEVSLRLAQVLRAAGQAEQAAETLRSVLAASPDRDRRLWDAWLEVSFVDLARSPAEILAALPTPAEAAAAQPRSDDYRNDVQWLLERLEAGEPIRINCGGDDYEDPNGRLFGRDRFALGGTPGRPWAMEIAGTDRAPIYRSERVFDPWLWPEVAAYVIPMPPGRYSVRLHFAELLCAVPGSRRFNVSIQGMKVIEDLDIDREVGFATAMTTVDFETLVVRGGLEIRFHPVNASPPKISAIEIEGPE